MTKRTKENGPERKAWINALHRCHNPNNPSYADYGGRGLTVSDDWRHPTRGFANFMRDMGKRPEGGYSLERVNNELGYSKENCIWADRKTQQNNRGPLKLYQLDFGLGWTAHRSPYIEYKGEIKSLAEWAKVLGIHGFTLRQRFFRGMPVEEAFAKRTYKNGIKSKKLASLLLPISPTVH
jgi:hypothetical protein